MPIILQGVPPCTGFLPQQGRGKLSSDRDKARLIALNLKQLFSFCFALVLRSISFSEIWRESPDTNAVQAHFQNGDALPQENGALHTVLCPGSISQSTHKTPSTGQCPTHPSQKSEGHPLRQPKGDNGRVEQSEPKVFLNFIVRGVKTLCLMLAVVKINYSIVGKKGLKSHNNYIHFDVY